jgi:aspartyl protease family protein
MCVRSPSPTEYIPTKSARHGARKTLQPALFALALVSVPAAAQVRIVVDGQVHNVPAGIIRTITYTPGGRQTIRDQRIDGANVLRTAPVTATEKRSPSANRHPGVTNIATRIAPLSSDPFARSDVVEAIRSPLFSGRSPRDLAKPEYLPRGTRRVLPDESDTGPGRPLRIVRDPHTGTFVTSVGINGVTVRAIVDTGSLSTILSAGDARASGAIHDVTRSAPIAGIGGVTMLNVTLVRSMNVGGQQLGSFAAVIGQEGIPYTLLGQNEITRLGRIVIENDVMTISPRS